MNRHSRINPNLKIIVKRINRLPFIKSNSKRSIDAIFISDKEIKILAARFRNSNRATDVLAFPMVQEKSIGCHEKLPVGEIAISLDTAKRQAESRKVSLDKELTLLLLHGILHLSGKDDENREAYCEMRRCEFENLMRIL